MDAPIDKDRPHTDAPTATGVKPVRADDFAIAELQSNLERKIADVGERLKATEAAAGAAQGLLDTLERFANANAADRAALARGKAEFVERQQAVWRAESIRDAGYADERAKLDAELLDRRRALDTQLSTTRTTRLAEVAEAEEAERDRVRAAIEAERTAWDARRQLQESSLAQLMAEVETQKGAVIATQSALEGRRVEIEGLESEAEQRESRARRQARRRAENLQEEVDDLVVERRLSFESALQASAAETSQLRATIRSQTDLVGAYESLKQQLGSQHPAAVIQILNSKTDEITRLQEELATRPTEEMRTRYESLDAEYRRVLTLAEQREVKINADAQVVAQVTAFQHENSELKAQNASLDRLARNMESEAQRLDAELNRLQAAYERPAEVEARYDEIELPRLAATEIKQPPVASGIDELTWLTGIARASDAYGLHFNPRILKAFHTSLKTAEWSPLTVLAGVSGTGKSELPRLYSHFGGLFFEPLAVQPNWDSQESMLGFFNSIDNRFDSQPALRFLAQSQKPWTATTDGSGYPGLADAVSLVLLDEMNLAHPELYFAEFLSKLEFRRGMKGSDVPRLPVKIGAGMPPYELPLGRNVLWTGTMNQDETTKSLSDKVLDRSIIIHFPRPTELKRRLKLAALDGNNRGALLHKSDWNSWKAQASGFSDEEVTPFKSFIEEMNTSLAVVGRALGHRVWQSIEYYMANYPDVRAAGDDTARRAEAMHIAFEDQLVQKVMPKLRGIDTRGKSKDECLDKIRGQLTVGVNSREFNLDEDFLLATELGYGQFIWQTANYLKADDAGNAG
ncbi:chromosome partitioning protein ParA [Cryobacterium aureum]|uniref:chromosome partitioning protein ParA n=1 Tax=Cryobacterium aureum TaxID=995037 RepID=UPI000CF503E5|nr:chromosome partitioning protein ParA [Cryobacterium aureum]